MIAVAPVRSVVGRLHGALLLTGDGRYWLIGNTKEPCRWSAHGLEDPGIVDAIKNPVIELRATTGQAFEVVGDRLESSHSADQLCGTLIRRMLITRNASVSERLWRLVLGHDVDAFETVGGPQVAHVDWLCEMPERIWDIVRDTVLRCV